MTFNFTEISKRQGRSGFSGLRYAKEPNSKISQGTFMTKKPTFSHDSVAKTMKQETHATFSNESIVKQRFMDAKNGRLAGFKEVDSFEGRDILTFDPISDHKRDAAGQASNRSGKFQSGDSGEVFLNASDKFIKPLGKFVTLIRPNPYDTKPVVKIKIRQ